eukprot:UN16803
MWDKMAELSKLEYVDLHQCKGVPKGEFPLPKNLKRIKLARTEFDNFINFKNLSSLTEVDLSHCTNISNDIIADGIQYCSENLRKT